MEYKQFLGKMSCKDYLKYALFSLMEEKSIHKITVKELCDRAMINRSTFYAHYADMNSFYQSVMVEICAGLVDAVESESCIHDLLWDKQAAIRRYTRWYQHVCQHADEFRLFLGTNGTAEFREIMVRQGVDWYSHLLNPVKSRYEGQVSKEVLVHYIVKAHMGLLEYYLNSGMKYSPEYMAVQMVNITMAGPYSLLER